MGVCVGKEESSENLFLRASRIWEMASHRLRKRKLFSSDEDASYDDDDDVDACAQVSAMERCEMK